MTENGLDPSAPRMILVMFWCFFDNSVVLYDACQPNFQFCSFKLISMNLLHFPESSERSEVFAGVQSFLEEKGFRVVSSDFQRPWGGFFVLDEGQASFFRETFFPEFSEADFAGFEKLSPKFLIVAPNQRLSWQYHHRRSEIWRVVGGIAGVVVSDTDDETPMRELSVGDLVQLKQGERHRLMGTNGYGIVAEIWQHVDPAHPSDEDDIVRVQDDFGR